MHLYRSFAFLMSRMMTENGGYFVCKTRHLVQAGGTKVSTCLCNMSCIMRKPVFGISDHVQHKPGCTATEGGQRVESSVSSQFSQ